MSKQEKKALVPEFRFPEFQNDPDWQNLKLGDISDRMTEKVGDKKLTTVSITAGKGFVSQAEKFSRDISGKQYKNYIHLKKGEYSYNKGNSKTFPQGCIYELKEFDEVAAPNAFISFRFKENYVGDFYKGYFDNNYHGRQLLKYITSGARSDGLLNISPSDFFSISLPTPAAKAESEKVAECLITINNIITTHTQKLEALKVHKKGLMQQLFPAEGETVPKLRFPEFRSSPGWKEQKLEELAKRGSGHTPNKKNPENYNGGIKWVSLADSKHLDDSYIFDTSVEISEEGIKNSSAVLHPAETVILSRDAGVGKSAVLHKEMAVSQHFIAWQCNSEKLSNWFLYYTLQVLKPIFERIAVGNTIKTIGLPYFKELRIAKPSFEEQEKIASCLRSVDELISHQSQKLESIQNHKKSLTQKLFPSTQ